MRSKHNNKPVKLSFELIITLMPSYNTIELRLQTIQEMDISSVTRVGRYYADRTILYESCTFRLTPLNTRFTTEVDHKAFSFDANFFFVLSWWEKSVEIFTVGWTMVWAVNIRGSIAVYYYAIEWMPADQVKWSYKMHIVGVDFAQTSIKLTGYL